MNGASSPDDLPFGLLSQSPHDEVHSQMQIQGVLALIQGASRHVLDLGCGSGRVLKPLAEAGHYVVGVDHDEAILQACRDSVAECDVSVELVPGDLLHDPWPAHSSRSDSGFDAVVLLGNTLMTIVDVDDAVRLMQRVRDVLSPGGLFLVDDIPHDLWPELTEGNWLSGMSEDEGMQMVWHPAEPIFTIRTGDHVDAEMWDLTADDLLLRLWTLDALRLTARLAGLSAPEHQAESGLLLFRNSMHP